MKSKTSPQSQQRASSFVTPKKTILPPIESGKHVSEDDLLETPLKNRRRSSMKKFHRCDIVLSVTHLTCFMFLFVEDTGPVKVMKKRLIKKLKRIFNKQL